MVETWRDSWFEEGTRPIYIMPPHSVDAILPLQVEPAPLRTARVFVGRIELLSSNTTPRFLGSANQTGPCRGEVRSQ